MLQVGDQLRAQAPEFGRAPPFDLRGRAQVAEIDPHPDEQAGSLDSGDVVAGQGDLPRGRGATAPARFGPVPAGFERTVRQQRIECLQCAEPRRVLEVRNLFVSEREEREAVVGGPDADLPRRRDLLLVEPHRSLRQLRHQGSIQGKRVGPLVSGVPRRIDGDQVVRQRKQATAEPGVAAMLCGHRAKGVDTGAIAHVVGADPGKPGGVEQPDRRVGTAAGEQALAQVEYVARQRADACLRQLRHQFRGTFDPSRDESLGQPSTSTVAVADDVEQREDRGEPVAGVLRPPGVPCGAAGIAGDIVEGDLVEGARLGVHRRSEHSLEQPPRRQAARGGRIAPVVQAHEFAIDGQRFRRIGGPHAAVEDRRRFVPGRRPRLQVDEPEFDLHLPISADLRSIAARVGDAEKCSAILGGQQIAAMRRGRSVRIRDAALRLPGARADQRARRKIGLLGGLPNAHYGRPAGGICVALDVQHRFPVLVDQQAVGLVHPGLPSDRVLDRGPELMRSGPDDRIRGHALLRAGGTGNEAADHQQREGRTTAAARIAILQRPPCLAAGRYPSAR
ncbi:hypothetical protein H0E84_19150 [Luteimonas sp. SJ-92]|uniref:Uncharacterized protein n=1 Tax=Luteimonas salinisoli TaxID=2752307 RepID=A0A853JI01_9GAMM|nr:hypothetical protein [Luteimonas salinisoli]NZA28495.1 hypothetical protein [Luteimonas salinisoli]